MRLMFAFILELYALLSVVYKSGAVVLWLHAAKSHCLVLIGGGC
jgi:hypothetical protein